MPMVTSALPPPTFDPLAAPTPKEKSPTPWAVWLAVATIAGVLTFFLMRQPRESAPHSLAPLVVASTRPPEALPDPAVENSEPEVAPEAVVALAEEPVEEPEAPTPMTSMAARRLATASPMNARMTNEPRVASMEAAMESPAARPTPMPAMSTSSGDLPETPTRQEVQSALLAVRGSVQECMGRGGRVPVRVTVSGRTGRVTTAQVQDAYFARQPTGGCIARAVRRARFPRFQRERLVVVYPYEF